MIRKLSFLEKHHLRIELKTHGFDSEQDFKDALGLIEQGWHINVLAWLKEKHKNQCEHPNQLFIRGKWQTIEQALKWD